MSVLVATVLLLSLGFLLDFSGNVSTPFGEGRMNMHRSVRPRRLKLTRPVRRRPGNSAVANIEADKDMLALISSVLGKVAPAAPQVQNIFADDDEPEKKALREVADTGRRTSSQIRRSRTVEISAIIDEPVFLEDFNTQTDRILVVNEASRPELRLDLGNDGHGRTTLCADNHRIAVFGHLSGESPIDTIVVNPR